MRDSLFLDSSLIKKSVVMPKKHKVYFKVPARGIAEKEGAGYKVVTPPVGSGFRAGDPIPASWVTTEGDHSTFPKVSDDDAVEVFRRLSLP